MGSFVNELSCKMNDQYKNIVLALPKQYQTKFKNVILDLRRAHHMVMNCNELQNGIYMLNYDKFEKTYDSLSINPRSSQFASFALSVFNEVTWCANRNIDLVINYPSKNKC